MPLNISFCAVQRHGAFEWLQILYTQSLLSFFTRWSNMFNSFYVNTHSSHSLITRCSDVHPESLISVLVTHRFPKFFPSVDWLNIM